MITIKPDEGEELEIVTRNGNFRIDFSKWFVTIKLDPQQDVLVGHGEGSHKYKSFKPKYREVLIHGPEGSKLYGTIKDITGEISA